jgi:hypothetical protein
MSTTIKNNVSSQPKVQSVSIHAHSQQKLGHYSVCVTFILKQKKPVIGELWWMY